MSNLYVFLFVSLLTPALSTGLAAQSTNPSKPVASVTLNLTQKTPLEALLDVARITRTPIGISCSDSQLLSSEFDYNYKSVPTSFAVNDIIKKVRGYTSGIDQQGVIVVQGPSTTALAELDRPLGTFRTYQPLTAVRVSAELWGVLQLSLNAARKGYGGVVQVPAQDRVLPMAEVQNASVTTVLSWIVAHNGNMAWIIWPPPTNLIDAAGYRLWNLVFFDGSSTQKSMCCVYPPSDVADIAPGLKAYLQANQ